MRIELCLMVWNEIDGLKVTIPNLPNCFDRVYAIDGGSTDGSLEFLKSMGIETLHQSAKGYNQAYIDAFKQSYCDFLIFFHPKGTIEPSSLETIKNAIDDQVDLIVMSRMMPGAQNEEDLQAIKVRKWGNRLFSLLAKLRWGMTCPTFIDDPLHGFRGISRRFYSQLILDGPSLNADLLMVRDAYRCKIKVKVLPVKEVCREYGESHFPTIKTGAKLARFVLTGW